MGGREKEGRREGNRKRARGKGDVWEEGERGGGGGSEGR